MVQAIKERADAIKASKMRIFVRRGGPNYQQGLDMMRRLGDEIGVPIEVGLHLRLFEFGWTRFSYCLRRAGHEAQVGSEHVKPGG